LQLAAVQAEGWLPLQALPVCLAACEAVKNAAGSSAGVSFAWTTESVLDGCQAESKAALQPSSSTWLAARTQVGRYSAVAAMGSTSRCRTGLPARPETSPYVCMSTDVGSQLQALVLLCLGVAVLPGPAADMFA
jgi:hypothetical protein